MEKHFVWVATIMNMEKLKMNKAINHHLSYSAFEAYDECPFKYKKNYIERIREAGNVYSAYGNAFHDLLDTIYKEQNFTRNFAFTQWPKAMAKELAKKENKDLPRLQMAEFERQGYTDIGTFFEMAQANGLLRPCLHSELAIIGKYRDCILRGKIDLIQHAKGGIAIGDWKTGKGDRKNLMQLALYAVMVYKKLGIMVDWLFGFYLKTKEVVWQKFDEAIQKEAFEHFNRIYNALINDVEFKPKKNSNCYFCMFNKDGSCPLSTVKKRNKVEL